MNNDAVKKFFDIKSLTWDQRKTRPVEVYDEFAKKHFYIKENDKVLDMGCGSGTFIPSIQKCSKTTVYGLDISPKMIDLAKPKFEGRDDVLLMAGDFFDTNLKDFDVIVCHNVYSHILDRDTFINKCKEVLKPHGILAITHFTGLSQINDHHGHCKKEIAHPLDSVEIEKNHFLKDFDLVEASDEDQYIMVFRKK